MKLTPYVEARISIAANGCWHWTGSVLNTGYGLASVKAKRSGAHRLVYAMARGVIPDGQVVDHDCHNRDLACPGGPGCLHRRCVNPDHLSVTSRGANSVRGKGRPAANLAKARCPQGHEYDRVDAKRGWRGCTTCKRAAAEVRRRAAGAKVTRAGATECIRGHAYTEKNTRWSNSKRHCKTCDADRQRANNPTRRKPCQGCGGPKPAGKRRRYCDQCPPVRSHLAEDGTYSDVLPSAVA
jgi:hypothetical protein